LNGVRGHEPAPVAACALAAARDRLPARPLRRLSAALARRADADRRRRAAAGDAAADPAAAPRCPRRRPLAASHTLLAHRGPRGVRIAGVKVGGLTVAEAIEAVQAAFARPLPVVVDRSRLELDPRTYASAYVQTAVAKARIAAPKSNVKLVVAVRGGTVRTWV